MWLLAAALALLASGAAAHPGHSKGGGRGKGAAAAEGGAAEWGQEVEQDEDDPPEVEQPWTQYRPFQPFHVRWKFDGYGKPGSRRNDWCRLARKIRSDRTYQYAEALEGMNVSVIMPVCREPSCGESNGLPWHVWDEKTNKLTGGFLVEIFDEVARRGKFNWHATTAITGMVNPKKGESWDEWLQWAVDNYDMALNWMVISPGRSRKQIKFAYPFMDLSPHIVAIENEQTPPLTSILFNWLKPLTPQVWLIIVVLWCLTALSYMLLEQGNEDLPEKVHLSQFGHATWLTAVSFSGGGGFNPKSAFGKVLVFSWTFAVLLIISAYTANLASMLVVQDVRMSKVTSIEDAVHNGKSVCIVAGGFFERYLRNHYPSLRVVDVASYEEAYSKIRANKCAATVVPELLWQAAQNHEKSNPGCLLSAIGPAFLEVHGSIAAREDTGLFCTDWLTHIITVIMHEMYLDGFIHDAKMRLLARSRDIVCTEASRAERLESDPLTARDMGGIFFFHGVVTVACIVVVWAAGKKIGAYRDMSDGSDSETSDRAAT